MNAGRKIDPGVGVSALRRLPTSARKRQKLEARTSRHLLYRPRVGPGSLGAITQDRGDINRLAEVAIDVFAESLHDAPACWSKMHRGEP
jgi:hypothetical protein